MTGYWSNRNLFGMSFHLLQFRNRSREMDIDTRMLLNMVVIPSQIPKQISGIKFLRTHFMINKHFI